MDSVLPLPHRSDCEPWFSPPSIHADHGATQEAPGSEPRHQVVGGAQLQPLTADTLYSRAGDPVKCEQVPSPGQRGPKAHPRLGAPTCPHLLEIPAQHTPRWG